MSDRYADAEDASGLQTLELFSETTSFNKWMFDVVEPYCKGAILEIGSGIGNLSELLVKNFNSVTLSDQKESYCRILSERFQLFSSLKGITLLDLANDRLEYNSPELIGKFDTVIALNVVEHIKDEALVLNNVKKLLNANGRFIMLVPAFNSLYNRLDTELGHYRRYNKTQIRSVFQQPDWQINTIRYFNSPGIFGWWLYGTALKRKLIMKRPLVIFNKLVPLFKVMDKLFEHFFGLSLITVATVNKTQIKRND